MKTKKEYWRESFIKSIYEITLLNKEIKNITELLVESIAKGSKIIIKHHNDADGLIGGYVIEKAIKSLAIREGKKPNILRYIYPYPHYSYQESIKDWNVLNKGDILLLIDFGSSKESLIGYNRVSSKGINVFVIDHHPPEFNVSSVKNIVFINPYKYLQNKKAEVSAGLLSVAIAENLSFIKDKYLLSLISLYGDKLYNTSSYQKLQSKIKIDDEQIKKYTKVIDFEIMNSYNDYGIIDFVLKKENEKIVGEIYNHILHKEKESIEKILPYVASKENIYVADYDNIILSYPPPGKMTGVLFEHLKEKTNKNLALIGIHNNYIIFRSNCKDMLFSKFYSILKSKLGEHAIEGGGHEEAGSIKLAKSIKISAKDLLDMIGETCDKDN